MTADAFILVMPDGTDDGFLWANGRDLAAAQRLFARPQRWSTLERKGFRVEPVTAVEHRARLLASIADHKRLDTVVSS